MTFEIVKFWIGFIGWLGFIWIEILRNYTLIEIDKEKPNYLHSFVIRAFAGIVCIAFMNPEFDPGSLVSWWQSYPSLIFEVSSFYLVFDPALNLWRGKGWDYQGKQSGWLDKLGKPYYYALKIMCVILLGLSTYVLLK